MSWDPRFHASLPQRAAIAAGRRLAAACTMQRCTLLASDRELAIAAVRARPATLTIEIDAADQLVLPPVLLRDVARYVELCVYSEADRERDCAPPCVLRFQPDRDPPVTFEAGPAMRPHQRESLDRCLDLAARIGVLAGPREAAYAPVSDHERIPIPVYTDAFPLLAATILGERLRGWFHLHAIVDGAYALALLAVANDHAHEQSFALDVPLDHDVLAEGDFELAWTEPGPEPWIPWVSGSSGTRADGRVYEIHAREGELDVHTVIDHMPVADVEAWLGERAGVELRCRENRT